MKDQWIEWLQDKQRHFFYGVIAVVAIFFVSFQLFQKFQKPASSNYLLTNLAFEKWMLDGEEFENLEKALADHPDLETKFGALIADKFIARNQGEKAKPFAENIFERVSKQTPEHTSFAQNTLLISEGKLEEALSYSLALSNRLDQSSLLYGFNLFRLASLHRALDHHDEERTTLDELDQFMQNNPKSMVILEQCYSDGNYTLSDYIKERKK